MWIWSSRKVRRIIEGSSSSLYSLRVPNHYDNLPDHGYNNLTVGYTTHIKVLLFWLGIVF